MFLYLSFEGRLCCCLDCRILLCLDKSSLPPPALRPPHRVGQGMSPKWRCVSSWANSRIMSSRTATVDASGRRHASRGVDDQVDGTWRVERVKVGRVVLAGCRVAIHCVWGELPNRCLQPSAATRSAVGSLLVGLKKPECAGSGRERG